MASSTKQTTHRRAIRRSNAGRKAKNYRARHGSTAEFAIHTPEADANAPAMAKGYQPKPRSS